MSDQPVAEVRVEDAAVVLVIQRRNLDEPAAEEMIDAALGARASHPKLPIVIDLSQVKFAPSVALGAFTRLNKILRLDNVSLNLASVDPRIRQTLRVTRIHTLLGIYDTVDDALEALSN